MNDIPRGIPMKDALKTYLKAMGGKPLDPKLLNEYVTAMDDEVIPRIIEDVEQREALAAELRFSTTAAERDPKKD
jgi:hypothetical protein